MGRIEFEKLINTRDLGGIEVPGGKIAPGRLIRSGMLGVASKKDVSWLADNVSTVIDFRSKVERDEVPDPEIEGAENIHVPIIDDLAAGVSRDSESDEVAMSMLIHDPDSAMSYMCSMYKEFPELESARKGYETFVRKLFENPDKAVLWHCTAGKDRAGFATAIVLEMLGADRETIIADYLMTNEYIKNDIDAMIEYYFGSIEALDSNTETALRSLFGARREFLETALSKAEELYGSFRGFIRDGLHIGDDEREAWKRTVIDERL